MATRTRKQPASNALTLNQAMPVAPGHPQDPAYLEHLDGDDDELPPESAVDRVQAMLGGVSADERAVVKVHRLLPNRQESWCDDYAPGDFEAGGMKLIREKWGPGSYRVRLYGERPGGGYGILRSADLNVEISREPMPATVANGGGFDTGGPLGEMMRQQAETQRLILDALTRKSDPLSDMKQTLLLMTTMREAMGLNNAPAQKSSVGELVEAMRELREAKGVLEGTEKPEDESLMGMVKTLLPSISAMIGQQRQQGAAVSSFPTIATPPAIATALPPSASDAAIPPAPSETDDMGIKETAAALALRGYLRALCMMAEKGAPIESGAALVADKMPDEMLDLMELDIWFDLLLQVAPECRPYQEWFTAARNRALEMLQEEGDAEDDAELRQIAAVADAAPPAVPAKSGKKPAAKS